MRTMKHNSRTNANGRVHGTKHNDRNFDVALADNIDEGRVHLNEYWHVYQDTDGGMTFEAAELRFYEEHFSKQLEQINAKYVANRHPERCRDMAAWKMVRQNAPEETTLQVGKMEAHVDGDLLMECFHDYNRRLESWNEAHGRPFTQLTYARHEDEAVPHVQTRRVWHYMAEDGSLRVGQERALEQAGVELPHPDQKPGRRNNRKMTFDRMTREMWLDVLFEHGIAVEREALPDGRHNRDKEDMIRDKYQGMLDKSAQMRTDLKVANQKLEAVRLEASDTQDFSDGLARTMQLQAVEMMDKRAQIDELDKRIDEAHDTLDLIRSYGEYCATADTVDTNLDLGERTIRMLPPPKGIFRPAEQKEWLQGVKDMLTALLVVIGEGIRRLLIYESRHNVPERRSELAQERAVSLADKMTDAFSRSQESGSGRLTGHQKNDRSLG